MKRVSVIVPNYNYSRYLEQRFSSIFAQTYPIFEIIVLDDASTDKSVEIIEACLAKSEINSLLIKSDQNSGSVFQQWQKGVSHARGDFIWICEADDLSDGSFLEKVMDKFNNRDVVMSYAQSRQVDENDRLIAESYLKYTNGISTEQWKNDYICDGKEELSRSLSIKNTIPNVSAVVFKKDVLQNALDTCSDDLLKLNVVGDWLVYAEILRNGSIGYVAESLNTHRRHQTSASMATTREQQLTEIFFLQQYVSTIITVPQEIVEKAETYIQNVSRDWGVQPDRNSPLLKRLLNRSE